MNRHGVLTVYARRDAAWNLQLLALLKEAKMKERFRTARADISARFPLPETFWRDWIADEILAADR